MKQNGAVAAYQIIQIPPTWLHPPQAGKRQWHNFMAEEDKKSCRIHGKKTPKNTQRKRCQTASLQPVLTDLQTGVQHSGKEKPKINQQEKSIPGCCIGKLQSYYLIQGKMPNFSFHTTFLPKQNNTKATYTQTQTASHTHYVVLAEVGSVSARFWLGCDGLVWESEESAWLKI